MNDNELDARRLDLRAFLSKRLPDNRIELEVVLRDAESRCIGVLTDQLVSQTTLLLKRQQFIHPKDKDFTDLDRKIQLDSFTSEYQAEFDELAGLEKLLEQRIEVIKTLLSS